jgi:hypothetical protein
VYILYKCVYYCDTYDTCYASEADEDEEEVCCMLYDICRMLSAVLNPPLHLYMPYFYMTYAVCCIKPSSIYTIYHTSIYHIKLIPYNTNTIYTNTLICINTI